MNEQYRQRVEPVVQEIKDSLKPGKIFCYAVITHMQACWSTLIMPKEDGYEHIHFYLLVISHLSGKKKMKRLLNKMQKHDVPGITASIIGVPLKLAQRYIHAGDKFINTVLTEGYLLYSDDKLTLPPFGPLLPDQQNKRIEQGYIHLAMAHRYYNTAVQIIIADDQPAAMLQFHEAVKEACLAVIKVNFSASMKRASLESQWGIIQAAMPWLDKIFPQNTEEEDELFQDLCAVPRRIRKPNYHIAPHKVNVLSPRVNNMLDEIGDYLNNFS